MSDAESFFDTSVLLYLLSAEPEKADRVEELLEQRGAISVQVLNEFTAVATRKLGLSFAETREVLGTVALFATRTRWRSNTTTRESRSRRAIVSSRQHCWQAAGLSIPRTCNIGKSSTSN